MTRKQVMNQKMDLLKIQTSQREEEEEKPEENQEEEERYSEDKDHVNFIHFLNNKNLQIPYFTH